MTRRMLLPQLMLLALAATALSPAVAGAHPAESRPSQQSVKKINYPGKGIEITRLSGDERKLKGTSPSFKKFVRARLDELFEEAGSKSRCATSPTVIVDRYHSKGFATVGEGWYGKCPSGGYAAIYAKTDSGWQQILSTQDVRYCQDLAFWGVPDFIGVDCINENGRAIRYHLRKTDTASPEASARRVARLVGGYPPVPSVDVLTPSAAEQIAVLVAKKAYVEVDSCVAAGDSDPLADQLGRSPFGCSVTASKAGKKETFLLRMDQDFVVTDVVSLT